MAALPSTTIALTHSTTGKTQFLSMPYSKIFWQNGKRISLVEAVQGIKDGMKGVEVSHLTLGEAFDAEVNSADYICSRNFDTKEEHFSFWLSVMLGYNFSDVDEKTYLDWYNNLNNGLETKFL